MPQCPCPNAMSSLHRVRLVGTDKKMPREFEYIEYMVAYHTDIEILEMTGDTLDKPPNAQKVQLHQPTPPTMPKTVLKNENSKTSIQSGGIKKKQKVGWKVVEKKLVGGGEVLVFKTGEERLECRTACHRPHHHCPQHHTHTLQRGTGRKNKQSLTPVPQSKNGERMSRRQGRIVLSGAWAGRQAGRGREGGQVTAWEGKKGVCVWWRKVVVVLHYCFTYRLFCCFCPYVMFCFVLFQVCSVSFLPVCLFLLMSPSSVSPVCSPAFLFRHPCLPACLHATPLPGRQAGSACKGRDGGDDRRGEETLQPNLSLSCPPNAHGKGKAAKCQKCEKVSPSTSLP